ncbi:hypothetical protein [Paraburkholderia hospita]|uniref:hypothetical protein n=1 Tax=Paraburkholderia hospita TaxID=169430 RepID=UPI000B341471|nr:hypothetical protein [Paraburkholderia hospita]OUL72719.1 hypothetical protein CA603_45145 [Paraburkholderia hospita]
MNTPLNLDLRGRAELLTYLVVSQLLARTLTGEWLSSQHTVESTRLWLATNGGGADLMQRVRLSSYAHEIALSVAETMPDGLNRDIVVTLLTENLRVDFRAPIARAIYQTCLDHLVHIGWIT